MVVDRVRLPRTPDTQSACRWGVQHKHPHVVSPCPT
jgi:hypothetical protein